MTAACDAAEIYRTRLEGSVEDPGAVLGESLDALFGFDSGERSDPARVLAAAGSWRARPDSFRSELELRLQEVAETALRFAADIWRVDDLPAPDCVCVRIANDVHGSPSVQRIDGVFFVVFPAGFLKSLENAWRTHAALADLGAPLAAAGARAVHTNHVGGGSVEAALSHAFGRAQPLLAMLLTDVGWHHAFDGSLAYPEAILTAGARMGWEAVHGLYSSDDIADGALRPRPGPLSQLLARAVLVYIVAHEIAHVLFADDPAASRDGGPSIERACDHFATTFAPIFTQSAPPAWALRRDGAVEYACGLIGFFEYVELRELTLLVFTLATRQMTEGDAAYAALSDRLTAIAARRQAQIRHIERLLGPTGPDAELFAALAIELHAAAVGVQMLGVRMLLERQSSFAGHMERWIVENGLR